MRMVLFFIIPLFFGQFFLAMEEECLIISRRPNRAKTMPQLTSPRTTQALYEQLQRLELLVQQQAQEINALKEKRGEQPDLLNGSVSMPPQEKIDSPDLTVEQIKEKNRRQQLPTYLINKELEEKAELARENSLLKKAGAVVLAGFAGLGGFWVWSQKEGGE